VVLTDGNRSSGATTHLAQRRSAELAAAMAVLGVPPEHTVELGYPDGELASHLEAATAALRQVVVERRPDDVYVTCLREGHPDHAAASVATRQALRGVRPRPRLWEYPIWLWSDWPVSRRVTPLRGMLEAAAWLVTGALEKVGTNEVRDVKTAALHSHGSQLGGAQGGPDGSLQGEGLPAEVVDRALDGPELFFRVGRPARLLVGGALAVALAVGGVWTASRVTQGDRAERAAAAPSSPLAGFPSRSSTGVPAGTKLVRVPQDATSGAGWHVGTNGNVIVDRPGTVLSGLDIRTAVQNEFPGLVVRKSRIRCIGENDWCLVLGPGSLVEDVEVGGLENGHTFSTAVGIWSGSSGPPSTIRRVDVHHLQSGLRLDGNVLLEDSFLHDFPMGDPVFDARLGTSRTDMHTDAVLSTRGGGVVVRHNRFESGNTANLFVQWDVTDSKAPHIGSYLVERNLFTTVERNGQNSSWGVAVEEAGVDGPITVRDNTFERGWGVGPLRLPDGAVATGNTYVDGTPIP
jgi:LmbE family N-acetylglucosaminyl deacetylase